MEFLNNLLPLGKSLALALLVAVAGWFLISRFVRILRRQLSRGKLDPTLRPFLVSLADWGLKLLLGILVIGILGIDTSSFVAVLAAGGFAIGLAFQGYLSNFAGGVLLLITRPIQTGDFIEVEESGYSGTVRGIRILYTELVTLDNRAIHIPNGILSNTSIINYSQYSTRRVDLVFSAPFDTPPEEVLALLRQGASEHPLALQEPAPFARLLSLGEGESKYALRVWTRNEDYWTVYHDLLEGVKAAFDKAGLTVPYPRMEVHLHEDGKDRMERWGER